MMARQRNAEQPGANGKHSLRRVWQNGDKKKLLVVRMFHQEGFNWNTSRTKHFQAARVRLGT